MEEIEAQMASAIQPELYRRQYEAVFGANSLWNQLDAPTGELYAWDDDSTYIQEPPFFTHWSRNPAPVSAIREARILALFGDSITTDHISPAGNIGANTPAARYLTSHGLTPRDFNTYGSRRGNHEVMMRGTFANIRIRNQVAPNTEGGLTRHFPDGTVMSIYDAAMQYRQEHVPLVIFAGKEYGTGSSRDWAAKGTALLGVKAVIAESFERIHRSNLVGMGVLPLQLHDGQSWRALNLTGDEQVTIVLQEPLSPLCEAGVVIRRGDGSETRVPTVVRLDTPVDVDYYRTGGILQTVLGNLMGAQ
jgi:aconitate hydratase